MKGFDTLKIKSAVKNHNKFDLSRTHLTTMDFGQIVPLLAEETVPGDKFSINAEYFSRLAPLAKPTYGKFQFKTVAGFVPYHQLAFDAEAWLAGKTTFEGQTPHHRYFTIDTLHTFLTSYCLTSTGATAANSVYTYKNSSGTVVYNIFNGSGKYFVKILTALGYAMPEGVDLQTSSTWYTQVRSTKLSAYPLLAFAKLYNDYMSQSQRYNSSALSDVLLRIKNGLAYSGMWNNSTGEIQSGGMNAIFANLFLQYDNDYFTSAWQNANAALNSLESVGSVAVPEAGSVSNLSADVSRVYANVPTNGTSASFSQRALDFLKSFDDWVRRNNYSGSRAVQQVYSRFGIKTDDYRTHYAQVITTDSLPIQVGDITSTSDTTGATLGEYAGKGIMSGSKGFSVSVSDYGILLVLGFFTVSPMMAYGFDRKVLRNAPLDYYNPEFDGLGADAISYGEVFENSMISPASDSSKMTNVFGFTERYNAYRYGRDQITGDFRYDPAGTMNVWHTGRDLSTLRANNTLVAQASSVNALSPVNSEYNRIFSTATSAGEDHFYLTARFNVSAVRPMLNLNQVPQLGEGDTVVPRNGNVIS